MKKMISLSLILVLIDQIFKFLITSNFKISESYYVIKNFFYITYIENTGAAFSILKGNALILIILSIVVLLILFYFIKKEKNYTKIMYFSNLFLIAGIISNLIDRIRYQSVIDYLYINIDFIPIFNLADVFIIIGVLLFIFEITRSDKYVTNNCK